MKTKSLRWPLAIRVILLIVLLSLFYAFAAYAQAEAQNEQEPAATAGTTYTVQYGDTLAGIAAAAYGVGEYYEPLCVFNGLEDCHILRVGSQIVIPLLDDLGELPALPESTAPSEETPGTAPPAVPAEPTPTPLPVEVEPTATPTPEPTPFAPDPAVPEEIQASLRTIVAGDTLEAIAQEVYNNATLAGRLCAYNQLPDCKTLEVGIRIFAPVLDVLLFGTPHTFLPPVPVQAPDAAETSPSAANGTAPPTAPAEERAPAPSDDAVTTAAGPSATPTPHRTPVASEPIPTVLREEDDAELNLNRYIGLDSRLEISAYLLAQTTVPQVLSTNGPYTLFLPSDSAWVATETELIQGLFADEDTLDRTLRAYVVTGDFSYQDLGLLESVTSLNGRVWPIATDPDGTITVGTARISASTSEPVDGTIHLLNLVQP